MRKRRWNYGDTVTVTALIRIRAKLLSDGGPTMWRITVTVHETLTRS